MPVAHEEPTHAALAGSPGLCDVPHPVPRRYHTDNIGGTSTCGSRPAPAWGTHRQPTGWDLLSSRSL